MFNIRVMSIILLIGNFIVSDLSAMIFDNRFVPLLQVPRYKPEGRMSLWTAEPLISTTSISIDDNDSQKEVGIPEGPYGLLDEGILGSAITMVGKINPLPTAWQNRAIPIKVDGKQQIEGITFSIYQQLCDWLVCGGSAIFMRCNARHEFHLRDRNDSSGFDTITTELSGADKVRLDQALRLMFSELSLYENQSAQTGFGDLDLFVGWQQRWDFCCKCRRIDADVLLGLYAPTGVRQNLDVPPSIPFGGDGYWGIYLQGEGLFELKEDIKFGVLGRVIKRLPHTGIERLSVLGEPSIFGATVGCLRRNPGFTFVFAPYLALEHLRYGLGFLLGYTLIHHMQDRFTDKRSAADQAALPINLQTLKEHSGWGSDYFSLSAFYELEFLCKQESLVPTLTFRWDIPATLFVGSRMAKTHGLYFGIECAF